MLFESMEYCNQGIELPYSTRISLSKANPSKRVDGLATKSTGRYARRCSDKNPLFAMDFPKNLDYLFYQLGLASTSRPGNENRLAAFNSFLGE